MDTSVASQMEAVLNKWREAALTADSHQVRELAGHPVAWWFDTSNATTRQLMTALASDPTLVIPSNPSASSLLTTFLRPGRPMSDTVGNDKLIVEQWIEAGCPLSDTSTVAHAAPAVETPNSLPSTEEEKIAFHKLVNIEANPDFRPKAQQYATAYLAAADYGADQYYGTFPYTEATFRARMNQIYNSFVANTMYQPHFYDQDIISVAGKFFKVGKASNRVVVDNLIQKAPFNFLDGVWLQNIMAARPSDVVKSKLFDIWADEVGNGEVEQNHANVYENLLRSRGAYLPSISSQGFTEYPFSPGAWRTAVFQMCVGLFPEEFFPELLGMTLFLEWEATPTLTPTVRMLRGRQIDPLFYQLHVAIDNISEGHGALAIEAIVTFLEEQRRQGGDTEVQRNWQRIWNGYVTWATAGFLGVETLERRLLIDKKVINVGTATDPVCYPDLKAYYRGQMLELVARKAEAAKQVHGGVTLAGVPLNQMFDKPNLLIDALIAGGFVDIAHPRDSRIFELMTFEGPMHRVFSESEKEVILDWIESLSEQAYPCLEPLPENVEEGWPEKMVSVVVKHSTLASLSHSGITLTNMDGVRKPLPELFGVPSELLGALVASGWVVPGSAKRSIFYTRVLDNGGPMSGVFSVAELSVVENWIDSGAELPDVARVMSAKVTDTHLGEERARMRSFAIQRPLIGMGTVH
jgi:hypothetical protein